MRIKNRKGKTIGSGLPWVGVSGPNIAIARDALAGNFLARKVRSGGRIGPKRRRVRGCGFIPL